MKIKEFAQRAGISKQTIRYYESIGLLSPKRNINNYREYSDFDLKDIEFILKLKLLPMPLSDVKLLLQLKNQEISLNCKTDTIQFIEKYQKTIRAQIHVLGKTEKLLSDIMRTINHNQFLDSEEQIMTYLQNFEEEI